jgi:hypothetical protein
MTTAIVTDLRGLTAAVDPLHPDVARRLAAAVHGEAVDVRVAGTGQGAWYITAVDVDAGTVACRRHGETRTAVPFGALR